MSREYFQPLSMSGYKLPVFDYRTPPEIASGTAGRYPVIIAGAGLAGLTAALELGSRGITTIVCDDDNSVGAAGLSSRGICYAKRSLEILDRFGIADRIRAKGVTWSEGDVYRHDARLFRFALQLGQDQKFPPFVNLQQFYVEQYLVEHAMEIAAIDLRWKNKLVDVRQRNEGVDVTIETPDGRYSATCSYLLAADGPHSTVRERIGAKDAESALFEDQWCIADVRMKQREEAVRRVYLDSALNEGGAIWYHQMADGIWRTDWQISHYDDPDAEATVEKATERIRKLVGRDVEFELIWVGPWRFRKRYLKNLVHGRILFLGDAAAQHAPWGARGGNRAIQDANNLAWKLALVLSGKASSSLLMTYDSERHQAAREAVNIASQSALFIGPESDGQRLFRDAILELAKTHKWAQDLMNVGRLSTACTYRYSPLCIERPREWEPSKSVGRSLAAKPGAAAPDGVVVGNRYFSEYLQGGFTVAWFGADGGNIDSDIPVSTFSVPSICRDLWDTYEVDVRGATYVFRPDGHILARCRGIDASFASHAISEVLSSQAKNAIPPMHGSAAEADRDRLYVDLAAYFDGIQSADQRPAALARLVMCLADKLSTADAFEAISMARNPAAQQGGVDLSSAAQDSKTSKMRINS